MAEDVRHIDNRPTSVGFDFDYEVPLLAPLPFEEFDIGLTLTPMVDKTSRITVRQNKYSVPARFIGTNVRVSLRADEVWVFERNKLVVRHPRSRAATASAICWTTTWRSCGTSPAPWSTPPGSPRPAKAVSSPTPTTRSGPRPGSRGDARKAPGP